MSGERLGNLIALPLYQPTLQEGNSCFIDEATLIPINDQWKYLENIQRISIEKLDEIYQERTKSELSTLTLKDNESSKLSITLKNDVRLNRSAITPILVNYLKNELNFSNAEYFVKKKTGRNTWDTNAYFKCIIESDNEVIIPRGFIGKLLRFCKTESIEFEFRDKRKKFEAIAYSSEISLREYQKKILKVVSKKDFGVIVAPPGAGKTVIGLKMIQEKQQPALIVVHRKQLADQWMDRIETFLNIPKREIGRIGQGKSKIGKAVTVAMIQSLAKKLNAAENEKIINSFGIVIIDECHHIPAESYRNVISKLNTYYQYGLTATPFRKYNDGKLIFIHLGEIITEVKPEQIKSNKRARIVIRKTQLDIPYNSKTDQFETLSKVLIHDSTRNKLIISDIKTELDKGKKVVVITERKDHIETLYQFLKHSYEAITLSGDDSESNKKLKWKLLKEGNYQILITTGQYFGEGTDLENVNCLFLVYPFSFKGKLIQYIGRVQRGEITPVIYDYRDGAIDYLNRLFLKRNTYYRQLEKQASLFEDHEEISVKEKKIYTINETIKVPIEKLDFRYGAIAFHYSVPKLNKEIEFEVENDNVRPEFDVLKPYFAKTLKTNNVKVSIKAEFEDVKLVSQLATSEDLNKINQEIIESVKFRFIEKNVLGRKYLHETKQNLLDITNLPSNTNSVYQSEEELLNNILDNGNVKHYRQLRFLSEKHLSSILKLRFVLNPFSFVFLLEGAYQYHLVLETLDTEEATYIWHLEKDTNKLKYKLKEVDEDLNMIRNHGRQVFLEQEKENFSRIMHNYTDARKGFIIWKDQLDERLV